MAKKITVIPLKTTKLDGNLVKGGQPIEISEAQKAKWIKQGILSDGKTVEVKTVDTSKLEAEIESLKNELSIANKKLVLKDMTVEEIRTLEVDFKKLTDKDDLIQAVIDSGIEVVKPENDLLGK